MDSLFRFWTIYIIFSCLSFFYKKRYPSRVYMNWKHIIVLWSQYDFITKKRIEFAKKEFKVTEDKIYVTGKTNRLNLKNHISCQNTFDEAFQLRKKFGKEPLILISSRLHSKRVYNTFLNFYFPKEIDIIYVDDLFCFYSPFLPLGWLFAFINLIKDIWYNQISSVNDLFFLECLNCWRILEHNIKDSLCWFCATPLTVNKTQKWTYKQKKLLKQAKKYRFFSIIRNGEWK